MLLMVLSTADTSWKILITGGMDHFGLIAIEKYNKYKCLIIDYIYLHSKWREERCIMVLNLFLKTTNHKSHQVNPT